MGVYYIPDTGEQCKAEGNTGNDTALIALPGAPYSGYGFCVWGVVVKVCVREFASVCERE